MVAEKKVFMEEIWKSTETKYEVSNLGNIRRAGAETSLKLRIDKYGYQLVTLWVNGICLTRKVHRLVALAFIPNPDGLATVDHYDDVKTNNRADNLSWMSASDNMKKGFKTGAHKAGEAKITNRLPVLKNADIPVIRDLISQGLGNTEIGRRYGVTCGCIYSIRAGNTWKHVV